MKCKDGGACGAGGYCTGCQADRYGVILADPPWSYNAWKGKENRTADSHYQTMSMADLMAMRPEIDALAADNCALFMWATPPALREGMELVTAWGFRYVTVAFTWVKTTKDNRPSIGLGHYTRANAELCLLGIRGSMPVADHGVSQIIMAPRREHSRKPDQQYGKIQALYPDANRIELFARVRWPGWSVQGNQVKKFQPPAQVQDDGQARTDRCIPERMRGAARRSDGKQGGAA